MVYTRSGRRLLQGGKKWRPSWYIAALHDTSFLFRLRRVPFRFTEETFPTALEVLLVDPHIIEVGVANHKCRCYRMFILVNVQ